MNILGKLWSRIGSLALGRTRVATKPSAFAMPYGKPAREQAAISAAEAKRARRRVRNLKNQGAQQ